MKQGRDLVTAPIAPALLMFALPTLGSSVLQSANGSIDAVWVGRLLGENALAATTNGRDLAGRATRQVLYVGKSRNLAARVRSYFTAAETRPRIDEMVRIATGVEHLECSTELEAEVLELRLIATHSPRYNRRSKFPERRVWLKLTREPFPRLSIVRQCLADGADYFGPFSRRRAT